ncbi:G-protein-coupled receptor family protein [Cavenderia fasciculata]|uniref:G-protein-coupled receptor family protein n=1 Tax=Cavenderia fasciculata TaxID=261658 RepID=F4Q0F4_CACFS|nr:G-protein-coupled receptor family protein [Cavenderia fasciculata]EGG18305.1 G-protein-coupled receptor family protein [Cavenderia fasciculata]|eukprot:XP_004357128.1 G-protein-coupled receptor family protein [Cavenderia fasciculata]
MKGSIIIIILLISVFLITGIHSMDGDLDPNARCEPYKGYSICKGRLNNEASIYVGGQYSSQDQMNSTISTLFSASPSTCKTSNATTALCNNFFQQCISISLNVSGTETGTQALAVRPCRVNCEYVVDLCPLLTMAGIDCSTQNGSLFEFPVVSNTYNLASRNGPASQVVECLNTNTVNVTANSSDPFNGVCPSPFVYVNTTDKSDLSGYAMIDNTDCAMNCPSMLFSTDQWRSYQLMVNIVSTISFVAMTFNIFTYGVLNKKYDRHTIIVLFFSTSIFLMMLADIVFTAKGWELLCPEPGRYARQFDAGCAATGIIFQFGAVSAVLWWSCMSFDLWLVIRKVTTSQSYHNYYIAILNFVALVFTIVPLFEKEYGYGYGGLGCWMLSDKYQNAVFWIPLCVCLLGGSIFIILIIKEIYSVVSKVNREGTSGRFYMIKMNIRPILIILIVCGEFIYLFIYHFYVQANTDEWYAEMVEYLKCEAFIGGCSASIIPYSAQFTFLFFMRLLGIESLFFYGISRRTKKIWLESTLINHRISQTIFSRLRHFFKRVTSIRLGSGTSGAAFTWETTTDSQFTSKYTTDTRMESAVSGIQLETVTNMEESTSSTHDEL